MRTNRLVFIILIMIFSMNSCMLMSQSRRAVASFEKAVEAIRINDQRAAIRHAGKAIEIDDDYLEPHLLLAEVYSFRKDIARAKYFYERVFELNPMYDPSIALNLALYSYQSGEYSEAKEFIDFFFKYGNPSKQTNFDSDRLKKSIYFAYNAINNPVSFDPINLGQGINTKFDEYWPSLSADESTLVFTRQIPIDPNRYDGTQASMQEDLFVSFRKNDEWTTAMPIPGGVNTPLNEGAQCISADGNTIIFTACNRPDGLGSCDLYIMFRRSNKWTEPKNMKSVNSPSWDSNPSLTADGRILFFASSRPGGFGGSDIWGVRLDREGNALSKPSNLGPIINTEMDEVSPFIHPDGKSLYFASNGHIGMGELDLFVSKIDEEGNWSEPLNLGFPLNTHAEERSLIVNAKGNIAMFASAREEGKGLDIYYFEIPEDAKPTTVTYVAGYVYDIKTNKRLEAELELIDLETETIVAKQMSDAGTGEFLVCLPIDKDYAFNVSKAGYLFFSENFSLTNLENPEEPYQMLIPLQPIQEGISVIMKNIFFDFDSFDLLHESFAELNKITSFLKENPNLKIEIGGHTDNKGSKAYNQTLSENRAKSVYEYFIKQGIEKARLSYKGYDFSEPIADNETEEGRAKNRRTEFKVIGLD
jgi:outer membrane protein OmpA-like peptidoglycan-associated protein